MNLAGLVLASANLHPARVAVRMGTDSLTYQEFVDEGARVAAGLADAGVRPGDRVMLFGRNSPDFLVIYHAVVRLGAIFCPVHESFQTAELEYVLDNLEPTVIITDADLLDRLDRCSNRCSSVPVVVRGTRLGEADASYADLGLDAPSVGVVDVAPDDPALICYTSGSTARPHPVTRSHLTETFNAESYASIWDYQSTDVALVALPLSWVYGLSTLSQGLLHVGATIVLHADFVAPDVVKEITTSQVTLFAGTMSMYVAILHELQQHELTLPSLRHVYRGGEPVNAGVVSELERRLSLRLTDAYATTEVAPILAMDPVRDTDAPPGSAGRLVPGAQLRVVNEHGVDVATGEVGEAWAAGIGRMLGYWGEPALTAQQITEDGWFRTGDLVRCDKDGYCYLVGRSSDIIIRNGARIAPAEIESALAAIPGVRDSVAVGVPDEEFGENIIAFLQLSPGSVVTVDDIYDHLSDRIARFKIPGQIHVVERLPVSRNGKTDRVSIRNHALANVGSDYPLFGEPAAFQGDGNLPRLRLVD